MNLLIPSWEIYLFIYRSIFSHGIYKPLDSITC